MLVTHTDVRVECTLNSNIFQPNMPSLSSYRVLLTQQKHHYVFQISRFIIHGAAVIIMRNTFFLLILVVFNSCCIYIIRRTNNSRECQIKPNKFSILNLNVGLLERTVDSKHIDSCCLQCSVHYTHTFKHHILNKQTHILNRLASVLGRLFCMHFHSLTLLEADWNS